MGPVAIRYFRCSHGDGIGRGGGGEVEAARWVGEGVCKLQYFYKTKRLSPRKALISLLNSSIRKDNSNMTEMNQWRDGQNL